MNTQKMWKFNIIMQEKDGKSGMMEFEMQAPTCKEALEAITKNLLDNVVQMHVVSLPPEL